MYRQSAIGNRETANAKRECKKLQAACYTQKKATRKTRNQALKKTATVFHLHIFSFANLHINLLPFAFCLFRCIGQAVATILIEFIFRGIVFFVVFHFALQNAVIGKVEGE